jgi:hypothetical protein
MTKPEIMNLTPFTLSQASYTTNTPSLFLALALRVKHYRAITADIILGPSDVGTPVVDLVEGVVLRVSLLDLSSLRVQEHHVDTVAATTTSSLGNLEVTLPVEGEGVAAVGDGPFDEGAGVVGLFSVAFDELLAILVDGRKVVVLGMLV